MKAFNVNALDLKLILNALKLKLKTCFLKKVKDNSQSPSWIQIMNCMIKRLPKIVCNRTSCKRYYNLDIIWIFLDREGTTNVFVCNRTNCKPYYNLDIIWIFLDREGTTNVFVCNRTNCKRYYNLNNCLDILN